MKIRSLILFSLIVLPFVLAGCGDSTGPAPVKKDDYTSEPGGAGKDKAATDAEKK